MDPNETLKQLRALLGGNGAKDGICQAIDVLAKAETLWQALDEWLSKGGFLPIDWEAFDDPKDWAQLQQDSSAQQIDSILDDES